MLSGTETPGDDILAIRRFRLEELGALGDDAFDGTPVLRAVFDRLRTGIKHPLNVLVEGIRRV